MIQTYSSQQYQERHELWVKLTIIVFIGRQTLFFVVKVMGSTMTNSELCWLRLRGRAMGTIAAPSISRVFIAYFGLKRKWIDPHFSTGNKLRQQRLNDEVGITGQY